MQLTTENYYSDEANQEFLSNSQLKVWGECELRAYMQFITLEYTPEDKTCFTVGNYVGTAFEPEEAHKQFVMQNFGKIYKKPTVAAMKDELKKNDIEFKKSGQNSDYYYNLIIDCGLDYISLCEKKSEYILADKMIERGKSDPDFMKVMTGAHEQIFTCELFGHKFKIRIDVWRDDVGLINDLKTTNDFADQWITVWDNENGREKNIKVPFYIVHNYHRQLAVYREVLRIATGVTSRFNTIAAISKQDPPALKILEFTKPEHLAVFADELEIVERLIHRVIEIKAGAEPEPCNKNSCPVCRGMKKTTVENATVLEYERI